MSFYQRNQAYIIYFISFIILTLISIGIMTLVFIKRLWQCLFLACALSILPACKTTEGKGKTQAYIFEVGKAFTVGKLKELFPNANFDKDSLVVNKMFHVEQLHKIIKSPKLRTFFTAKGHVDAGTMNFEATVKWRPVAWQPVILNNQTVQQVTTLEITLLYTQTKKARDALRP